MNVYPFIEAEKSKRRNVKRACVLLQVSRSAFYADRITGPSQRERDDAELTDAIIAVYDESDGTYGAPRVHAELADQGRHHGRKRIARLMHSAGCRGRAPKRWRTTTVPDPVAALPADLIGRDFATATASLNARWCGDITYIHTWEGWLYLATVIDLTSRRVVGWATADHLRTDLIDQALANAVSSRRPTRGLIFHSDRGCQYTSAQYRRLADQPESGSRSAVAANAGTTPWPSRSSPPSRPSCSTDVPGPPGPPPTRRSSTGSRAGTTPADDTPHWTISAQPPTRPGSSNNPDSTR